MLNALATPLQLVCQTIIPANVGTGDSTRGSPNVIPRTILPDGYTVFPDIGMAYKYYNTLHTWNSARKDCIEKSSNLVIVDSWKKYEYITAMIQIGNGAGPHVGIHRLFDNVEWVSVTTGLPPAAIPWAPKTWIKNPVNQCLAMWNDGSGVGADECSRLRPYVCQIPVIVELEVENITNT